MKRIVTKGTGDKPMFTQSFHVKMIDLGDLETLRGDNTPIEVRKNVENGEGDYGVLAGYISTFDNADNVGDVIRKGAFTKTLQERVPKVLWYHDPKQPIGKMIEAWEDEKGLYAVMQLDLATQKGRETFSLYKMGAIDSFSIGFMLEKYEVITNDKGNSAFDIKEVRLFEVSAVTFPANELAVVESIKEYHDENIVKEDEVDELAALILQIEKMKKESQPEYQLSMLLKEMTEKDEETLKNL